MALAESTPSRRRSGDPALSIGARKLFKGAMENYLRLVTEVGVVQACILGAKPGLRTSYIWNVLTKDFTPEQMQQDPRFSKLDAGATFAAAQSRRYIPLRIANVIPSQAATIQKRYTQDGAKLSLQRVTDAFATLPEESTAQGKDANLDILIGEALPADKILEAAREIASRAVVDFGGDRTALEEVFGFSILNRLEDRKAGEMLKDIAFARNAQIEGGFMRGLELRAEPSRVLEEIMLNIFDDQTIAHITELDIRAAIESGALRCDFGKPRI